MARGKQTLTQRIALDGGRDIRRELEALGDEGKKAFEALERRANEASKATTGFGLGIVRIRRDLVQLNTSLRAVGQGFGEVAAQGLRVARNVSAIGIAVTGAAVGLGLVIKSAADAADAIQDSATAAGLAFEEYSRLTFAFKQNGADASSLNTAFRKLNVSIDEASKGSGTGADAFEQLGIKVTDASGKVRSAESVLLEVSDAFAKMPEGATKAALAVDLFGRSGTAVIQTLNLGSEAISKYGAEAERLGLVLTRAEVIAGSDFNDALDKLTDTLNALRVRMALLAAPAFTQVFDALTELVAENRVELMALAQTLVADVLPVIQDLIDLIAGRRDDVQAQWLLDLVDTAVKVGSAIRTVVDLFTFAFQTLERAVQHVLDPINALFGTDLKAAEVIITTLIFALLGGFRLIGVAVSAVRLSLVAIAELAGNVTAAVIGLSGAVLLGISALEQALANLFKFVQDNFDAFWEWLGESTQGALGTIGDFFQGFADNAIGALGGIMDFLQDLINAAIEVGKMLLGLGGGDSGGSDIQANAAGGAIRGAGTGTSDSILSWLSNGEYVIKAKAVRKYGLGMLNALNGLRLPSFNTGGLVAGLTPSLPGVGAPAFADGGQVSSGGGRPLTLQLGNEIFEGLIAPESTADRLVRYAQRRNLQSAGRKPSWVK